MGDISVQKAILTERCPKCRKGKLYKYPLYNLQGFYKMNQQCEHCGQIFDLEPGFYFGAMYISYAFIVALSVSSWIVLYVFFRPEFVVYLWVIIIANVLLLPFIFRYSRTLFLYGFGGVKYKKEKN